MAESRHIQALCKFLKRHKKREDLPPLDTGCMNEDCAALFGALHDFETPVMRLGEWELHYIAGEGARKVLDWAHRLGAPVPEGYKHFCLLANDGGPRQVVVGWKEPHETFGYIADTAFEIDAEYNKIENRNSLRWWLHDQYKKGGNQGYCDAMQSVYPLPDVPDVLLQECDKATFDGHQLNPPKAAELTAGGHLYFRQAGDGKAISVHKKGVRFINSKGKCASKNAKTSDGKRYGAISPEGQVAYFLEGGQAPTIHRLSLPDGKPFGPLQSRADEGEILGLAAFSHDKLILRKDCEVALYKVAGDELLLLDSIVSLGFDYDGTIAPVLGGRGFIVAGNQAPHSYLGRIEGDKLLITGKLRGSISTAYPHVLGGVNDTGDATYLAVTADRITRHGILRSLA